jgi:hypothetical protein
LALLAGDVPWRRRGFQIEVVLRVFSLAQVFHAWEGGKTNLLASVFFHFLALEDGQKMEEDGNTFGTIQPQAWNAWAREKEL